MCLSQDISSPPECTLILISRSTVVKASESHIKQGCIIHYPDLFSVFLSTVLKLTSKKATCMNWTGLRDHWKLFSLWQLQSTSKVTQTPAVELPCTHIQRPSSKLSSSTYYSSIRGWALHSMSTKQRSPTSHPTLDKNPYDNKGLWHEAGHHGLLCISQEPLSVKAYLSNEVLLWMKGGFHLWEW